MKVPVNRYIGLDLSITATGYCIVNQQGMLHGLVGSKKMDIDVRRFGRQAQKLAQILDLRQDDLIIVEDYAFGAQGQITRMAEYGGIVKYVLMAECGVPAERILLCGPGIMKKFLTGKGNAKKDMILKECLKRWEVDFADDNEADAFGLALCGMYANGERFMDIKPTLDMLDALDKFIKKAGLWTPGAAAPKKQVRKKKQE